MRMEEGFLLCLGRISPIYPYVSYGWIGKILLISRHVAIWEIAVLIIIQSSNELLV